MGNDDLKFEHHLTDDKLADLFRDLAQALDQNGEGDLAGYDIRDFERIKINIKRRFGQSEVKIKIQSSESEKEPTTDHPVKYKTLKKRMKSDFKHIASAVKAGVMPHPKVVEQFLSDSELMCTFPGKGDEFYPAFLASCENLRTACEQEDVGAARSAILELAARKSECHAVYD